MKPQSLILFHCSFEYQGLFEHESLFMYFKNDFIEFMDSVDLISFLSAVCLLLVSQRLFSTMVDNKVLFYSILFYSILPTVWWNSHYIHSYVQTTITTTTKVQILMNSVFTVLQMETDSNAQSDFSPKWVHATWVHSRCNYLIENWYHWYNSRWIKIFIN